MLRFVAAVVFSFCVATAATAERRVALVMGAKDYATIRPLDNAVADAIAMKDALEALDFEVYLETDRDLRRMRRALEDFVYDASGADVALVFFAGHGVEINGVNRLLPADADAASLEALENSSLPLEEVRETIARIAPIGLILLDACRDDPFGSSDGDPGRGAASLVQSDLPAGAKPGFGRLGSAKNLLYAFAAAPGQTASDGAGDNSPFTTALTKYIGTGGLEIRSVLTLVQQEVYDLSRGSQLPYFESGLPRTFFAAEAAEELPERERLLLAMADVTPAIRDEIESIAAEHDMPLAPLYAALIANRDDATLNVQQMLVDAAETFMDMRRQLALLSADDPAVAQRRSAAGAKIELGAFNEARSLLAQAIRIDTNARQTLKSRFEERTLSAARSYFISGQAARTALEPRQAIADLKAGIRLAEEIESTASLELQNEMLLRLEHAHFPIVDFAGAAEAALKRVAVIERKLSGRSPHAPPSAELTDAIYWLAKRRKDNMDHRGALAVLEPRADQLRTYITEHPESMDALRQLSSVYSTIATVWSEGAYCDKERQYRTLSFEAGRQAYAIRPDDQDVLRSYVSALRQYLAFEPEYESLARHFNDIAKQVIPRHRLDWLPSPVDSGDRIEPVCLNVLLFGQPRGGLTALELRAHQLREYLTSNSGSHDALRQLSYIYNSIADVWSEDAHCEEERSYRTLALEAGRQAYEIRPDDEDVLRTYVNALRSYLPFAPDYGSLARHFNDISKRVIPLRPWLTVRPVDPDTRGEPGCRA